MMTPLLEGKSQRASQEKGKAKEQGELQQPPKPTTATTNPNLDISGTVLFSGMAKDTEALETNIVASKKQLRGVKRKLESIARPRNLNLRRIAVATCSASYIHNARAKRARQGGLTLD